MISKTGNVGDAILIPINAMYCCKIFAGAEKRRASFPECPRGLAL
jgi:hypothetical protein